MPPAPAPESTNPQVSRLQAFLGGQPAPPQPPPPRPLPGAGVPQVIFSEKKSFKDFCQIKSKLGARTNTKANIDLIKHSVGVLYKRNAPQPVRHQNPNLNGPPFISAPPPPPIRRGSVDLKTKSQADQVSKMGQFYEILKLMRKKKLNLKSLKIRYFQNVSRYPVYGSKI